MDWIFYTPFIVGGISAAIAALLNARRSSTRRVKLFLGEEVELEPGLRLRVSEGEVPGFADLPIRGRRRAYILDFYLREGAELTLPEPISGIALLQTGTVDTHPVATIDRCVNNDSMERKRPAASTHVENVQEGHFQISLLFDAPLAEPHDQECLLISFQNMRPEGIRFPAVLFTWVYYFVRVYEKPIE